MPGTPWLPIAAPIRPSRPSSTGSPCVVCCRAIRQAGRSTAVREPQRTLDAVTGDSLTFQATGVPNGLSPTRSAPAGQHAPPGAPGHATAPEAADVPAWNEARTSVRLALRPETFDRKLAVGGEAARGSPTVEEEMRPAEVFVRDLSPDEGNRLKRLSKMAKHAAKRQRALICWASATGQAGNRAHGGLARVPRAQGDPRLQRAGVRVAGP